MSEDIELDDVIEEPDGPAKASSGEVTLFGWLTILAAICFIAVITLQVIEFMGYSAPPSVWPATP